ncbi:late competence protein ComER [Bacillus sp. FJAT-49736]|uniref:late competence protein ComER n=1 Tax=Bacillus sp. FJAT-49736 TaxID=2833582 RepID=UPI001BC8F192|nr:late competence protein ComER [Bacillus sp. FJAT-49736]MBS4173604.1 late competence protein ComER [Bacillus sp. FJAT-49736]
MKIGIIGTGNMGTILVESFVDSKAISPSNLYITNRTIHKAENLKLKYPLIHICEEIPELIQQCDLIFLCVKPLDFYPLLTKYKDLFTKEKCLVSITSPVSVEQLSSIVSCSCVRAIPSITNRASAGVSLLTFSVSCDENWRRSIKELLSNISIPLEIDQNITRVASDIVSCGPAFFSYLTQAFIDAAVKTTSIDASTATILAGEMLVGLGELLKKGYYTLPTLQEKVCVKGGITGEGIKVLENELGAVFENIFLATHEKFKEDVEVVTKQFNA